MLLHGGRFLLIFFLLQPTEARNPARRYTALWPKNARNGSIALHHDQYPATVTFPVLHGLLELAKGIAIRCFCLGDFSPHDSGLSSGAARAAMSLRPTRSASPGIPP